MRKINTSLVFLIVLLTRCDGCNVKVQSQGNLCAFNVSGLQKCEIYSDGLKFIRLPQNICNVKIQTGKMMSKFKSHFVYCHKVIFGNSRMKILLHSRGNSISWLNLSSLHSTRSSYLDKSRAIFWEYLCVISILRHNWNVKHDDSLDSNSTPTLPNDYRHCY